MGLRIPGILEVCGAFGWRVLGEDFAAGVGDCLVSSRSDLSQQGLELGEDLLDWVEVWGVFRQEHEAGSDIPDRLPHRLSLVRAEIVEDHDVAGLEGRDEELLDIGAKAFAVDRSIEQAGRIDPILAQGGEERCGLPVALRDLVDEPLAAAAPSREGGSCWSWSRSRR